MLALSSRRAFATLNFPFAKRAFFLFACLLLVGSTSLNGQTCSGNLASNPGFENGLDVNWSTVNGGLVAISADANSGTKAVKICGSIFSRIYQTKPAFGGKPYTLTAFCKKTGTAPTLLFLKFMDKDFIPLGLTEFKSVSSASYSTVSILKTAPSGTMWVEFGFIKDVGSGCLFGDDLCLTEVGGGTNKPDLQLVSVNALNINPAGLFPGGQLLSPSHLLFGYVPTGTTLSYKFRAWFSSDNLLSANDLELPINPASWTQNGGYGSPTSLVLLQEQGIGVLGVPANTPPGNYFLIVKVDADNTVDEANENNNVVVLASTFSVLPVGQPDLTLTNIVLNSQTTNPGQVFSYRFDLANASSTAVSGNFNIKAYLSIDEFLSPDDVQDGTVPTGNLGAGQYIPQVLGATTVPTSLPVGNYFLILKVDADNQIAESNENNNVLVASSLIQVVAPGAGAGGVCDHIYGNGTLHCAQQTVSGSPNVQVVFDGGGLRTRSTFSPAGQTLLTENLGAVPSNYAPFGIVSNNSLWQISADGSGTFFKNFTPGLQNAATSFTAVVQFGTDFIFLGWKAATANPPYFLDSLFGVRTDANLNVLNRKLLTLTSTNGSGSAYGLTVVGPNSLSFFQTNGYPYGNQLTATLRVMDGGLNLKSQKTIFSNVYGGYASIQPNICRGFTVTDDQTFGFCKSGACFRSESLEGEFVADTFQIYGSFANQEISTLAVGTIIQSWFRRTTDGGSLRGDRMLTGQLRPVGPNPPVMNDTIVLKKFNAAGALLFTKKVRLPDAGCVTKIVEANGTIYFFKRNQDGVLSFSTLDCLEGPPPPPPGGCAVNLLQNGGFENSLTFWEGSGGVISTTASAGLKSAKLCQNTSLRQTILTTAGKNLTLLFKARSETGTGKILSYIKYLSASWQPLVTEFFDFSTTTSFAAATVSKIAPANTAHVEIGFLKQTAGCVLVDEVCLSEGGGTNPLPDLVAVEMSISGPGPTTPIMPGDPVFALYYLANLGTVAASGTVLNKIFASTDATLDAGDLLLTTTSDFVAPANTYAQVHALVINTPANIPPGNYRLILQHDANNGIAESNEGNNVAVSPNTFLVGGPSGGSGADLKITITADKTTVPQWGNVTYTITAKNEGSAAISQANVLVWVCPGAQGFGFFTQANGLVFAGTPPQPTKGTLNSVTNLWEIGSLAAGQTAVLTLPAFTLTTAEKKVVAWSALQSPTDPDSQPNGSIPANCTPVQDDEAVWIINAGQSATAGDNRSENLEFGIRSSEWIFPNPTGDILNLNLAEFLETEDLQVVIFDNKGLIAKELRWAKVEFPLEEISLEGLQNGLYFVRFIAPNRRAETVKLAVQRTF